MALSCIGVGVVYPFLPILCLMRGSIAKSINEFVGTKTSTASASDDLLMKRETSMRSPFGAPRLPPRPRLYELRLNERPCPPEACPPGEEKRRPCVGALLCL